jgi:hypothetical protein
MIGSYTERLTVPATATRNVVGKELAEFSADCRAGVGEELPGQIE